MNRNETQMKRLPSSFIDKALMISVEENISCDIHLVLEFNSRIDALRLARSARLMVNTQPILGSRLVNDNNKLIWIQHEDPDTLAWFETVLANDRHDAITKVLELETEMGDRAFVIRLASLKTHDIIILSVKHTVSDGRGVVQFMNQLVKIYNILLDDPKYIPPVNDAPRDYFSWQNGLSVLQRLQTILRDIVDARYIMRKYIGIPYDDSYESWKLLPRTSACYVERRIEKLEYSDLTHRARTQGCSLFTVLLAGVARAFVDLVGSESNQPIKILIPCDLRRFDKSNNEDVIQHQSATASLTFDVARKYDFSVTLKNAALATSRMRKGVYGAFNPISSMIFKRLSYNTARKIIAKGFADSMKKPVPMIFSHLGRIECDLMKFDSTFPEHIHVICGSNPMPLLLVAGVEYRGALSIAAGFQSDSINKHKMQDFLDNIASQLMSDS